MTGQSSGSPGTAGSVVGLVLVWFVSGPMWAHSPLLTLALFAVAFAISCWISGRAEEIFNEPDSSKIVIDEVLGMAVTMFGNPITIPWMLAGFVLFRIFDVLKPFPASVIDRQVPGGAGVMLDDFVVAIYANILLQIAWRVLAH